MKNIPTVQTNTSKRDMAVITSGVKLYKKTTIDVNFSTRHYFLRTCKVAKYIVNRPSYSGLTPII
jgi:hypothetical protein